MQNWNEIRATISADSGQVQKYIEHLEAIQEAYAMGLTDGCFENETTDMRIFKAVIDRLGLEYKVKPGTTNDKLGVFIPAQYENGEASDRGMTFVFCNEVFESVIPDGAEL